MAGSITGVGGGIKLSEVRDLAGVMAEVELTQYDLTRQLTRLIAAKASQVQSRVELLAPVSDLKMALDAYEYQPLNDPPPFSLLVSVDNPDHLAELDDWYADNNGFPAGAAEDQARWQTLLEQAGLAPVTPKVPIVLFTYSLYVDRSGDASLTSIGYETLWSAAGAGDARLDGMTLDDTLVQGEGVSALGKYEFELAPEGTTVHVTQAWVLERARAPHLDQPEFEELSGLVAGMAEEMSVEIGRESIRLRSHHANLLNLLEGGTEVLKVLREARDKSHSDALEDDRSLSARQIKRERWLDRQNAQPVKAGSGHAPVAGSMRSAPFATQAPEVTTVPPDPDDPYRQSNV